MSSRSLATTRRELLSSAAIAAGAAVLPTALAGARPRRAPADHVILIAGTARKRPARSRADAQPPQPDRSRLAVDRRQHVQHALQLRPRIVVHRGTSRGPRQRRLLPRSRARPRDQPEPRATRPDDQPGAGRPGSDDGVRRAGTWSRTSAPPTAIRGSSTSSPAWRRSTRGVRERLRHRRRRGDRHPQPASRRLGRGCGDRAADPGLPRRLRGRDRRPAARAGLEAEPPYHFSLLDDGRERGSHGSTFERSVPLVIAGAGVRPRRRGLRRASLVDVAPTIAALLAVSPPAQAQGRPVRALLDLA
jgi:hypothetical protein